MNRCLIPIILTFLTHMPSFSQDEFQLAIGKKVIKTIALNDKHDYSIELEKGEFALLNVAQRKMDVKIGTYDPEGTEIEEFDSLNGSVGDELVLIDAKRDGKYRLAITPLGERKKNKKGAYEIQLIAVNRDIREHLNQVLQTLKDRSTLPGFAVGIVGTDTLLYTNAKGYARVENKTPYTPETVQNIASISKTFIGISLMMLVEEGKLTLDSAINDVLPFEVTNPYFPEKKITIRHLATHTSTINDFPIYYTKAGTLKGSLPVEKTKYSKEIQKLIKLAGENEDMTMAAFLTSMLTREGKWYKKKNFLKRAPGEEWLYSNVGATLAAYIVELVSGTPYNTFVERRILAPLQLKSAGWGSDTISMQKQATGYATGNLPLPQYNLITYPDSGIYLNSKDLGRYLMVLMKGYEGENGIISAASFQEIMKVQYEEKQGNHKGTKNGLFWWQNDDGFMGHNGGDTGVIAIMKFNPTTRLGITFVSNMDPTETDESFIPFKKVLFALKRYAGLL